MELQRLAKLKLATIATKVPTFLPPKSKESVIRFANCNDGKPFKLTANNKPFQLRKKSYSYINSTSFWLHVSLNGNKKVSSLMDTK